MATMDFLCFHRSLKRGKVGLVRFIMSVLSRVLVTLIISSLTFSGLVERLPEVRSLTECYVRERLKERSAIRIQIYV